MKKRILLILLALCTLATMLTACGSEATAQASEVSQNAEAQIQDLTDAYDSLKSDYDQLESDLQSLQEAHSKLEADYADLESSMNSGGAPDTAVEDPASGQEGSSTQDPVEEPPITIWEDTLPEGIEASTQYLDDFTLLVWYKNRSGRDMALTTFCSFADENQDPFMELTTYRGYFADGSDYIAVLDAWDPIGYYGLDHAEDRIYQKIQEANDALSMESWRNEDDSVTVTFYTSAEDGTSVEAFIFYLDENDTILGYDRCGLGFSDSMDNTFDAPDFDYADYIISYEAIA